MKLILFVVVTGCALIYGGLAGAWLGWGTLLSALAVGAVLGLVETCCKPKRR
ncbi:MAG: hypothetical protein WBH99_13225 [Azovibrio sp.]|uniref:hypothetical protein n=1 Tax=Azovibrio sp. TaxID=1872673 RepID=UPI003C76E9FF